MGTMSDTQTTNGNGHDVKTPTAIQLAHQAWVAAGAKDPSSKDLANVKKRILDADNAYQAAEQALLDARKARHEAAVEAIRLCGAKRALKLANGKEVTVAGRGDAIFYR